ncbi:2Fe-2S iron-sulfur cluster-binding protein [Novosphingobium sp. BL-8H]|uniref:2Fe-2S iron-sulfur cluster-binding protein n=1 Tax=Novosphingobium sp. BL-8H TaxID=3127640 RepID=UPI0037570402
MSFILVRDRQGIEQTVSGDNGRSVMEAIRDSGLDELLALCGGCCSCASCHVYVDQDFVGHLPPMSDDENDLLDALQSRNDLSRLACQIRLTTELDGLKVTIAPEE